THDFESAKLTHWGTISGIVLYYSGQPNAQGAFVTPAFIDTMDTPFITLDALHEHSVYLNDRWNVTRQLTLNLGLRFDDAIPFYDAASKSGVISPITVTDPYTGRAVQCNTCYQGSYQTPVSFPKTTQPSMARPVPRLSFVYDLFGNGKTALK